MQTANGRFYFVTPEDLVLLKLISARPRDSIDVQNLFFTKGTLDKSYMRHWVQELAIMEKLEEAIAGSP